MRKLIMQYLGAMS